MNACYRELRFVISYTSLLNRVLLRLITWELAETSWDWACESRTRISQRAMLLRSCDSDRDVGDMSIRSMLLLQKYEWREFEIKINILQLQKNEI